MTFELKRVELKQGPIHYRDVGTGPVMVFVHGLLVNGRLWEPVLERLSKTHRCIAPDWPIGAHSEPMHENADLSSFGLARLIADFLEALDLRDVTLVGNDSGGALSQFTVVRHPERIKKLVLTTCDAFEVFPPLAFRYLVVVAKLPDAVMALLANSMKWVTPLRRLPIAYGDLTRKRLSDELIDAWAKPALDSRIRRDTTKFLRSIEPRELIEAAAQLKNFKGDVHLIWTPEDKYFPVSLAHRLKEQLPGAKLDLISDAQVFVAIDQPDRLAELLASGF
ncbi:MAG: alpha/beta hydrolase [Archangium sp.]